MKKIISILAILISVYFLVGCFGNLNEVESIQLDYQLKETYFLNEVVDLKDIEVIVRRTSGQSTIAFSEVTRVSGVTEELKLDTSSAGTKTFKITYSGVSLTIQYTVVLSDIWDGVSTEEITPTSEVIDEATYNKYVVTKPAQLAWLGLQSSTTPLINVIIDIQANLDMGGKPWSPLRLIDSIVRGTLENNEPKYIISGIGYFMSGTTPVPVHTLIKEGTGLTIENLKFVFNVETLGKFGGVINHVNPNLRTDKTGIANKKTIFRNVVATGRVLSFNESGVFIRDNHWDNPSTHGFWEENYFFNCKSDVDFNVFSSSGNSGQLAAYAHFNKVYIDKYTLENVTTGIKTIQGGQSAGKYLGLTHFGTGYVYLQTNDETNGNIEDYEYDDISQTEFYANHNRGTNVTTLQLDSLTFEESLIGQYASITRVQDAHKVITSLSYTVGSGYPRTETQEVIVDSISVGSKVMLPIKFKYVSQNADAVNWPNYIYNGEKDIEDTHGKYTLGANVTVVVLQFDSNNNLIGGFKCVYANKPNR